MSVENKAEYIGYSPDFGTTSSDVFNGDGVATNFTMSQVENNKTDIIVTIDGLKQKSGDYDVSGNQLIFDAPPPFGTNNIEVTHLYQNEVETVSDAALLNGTNIFTETNTFQKNIIVQTTAEFANNVVFTSEIDNSFTTGPGDKNINWTYGNKQNIFVNTTGSLNFTFTDPQGPCNLILRVYYGVNVPTSITWPTSAPGKVVWPGDTVPLMTLEDGKTDIVAFYFDGANYYAGVSLNMTTP